MSDAMFCGNLSEHASPNCFLCQGPAINYSKIHNSCANHRFGFHFAHLQLDMGRIRRHLVSRLFEVACFSSRALVLVAYSPSQFTETAADGLAEVQLARVTLVKLVCANDREVSA